MYKGLKEINLSLSSACGAKCIYCPTNRGDAVPMRNMSLETAKKIVDEVASDEFGKYHQVESFHLSENGDGLINPHFTKIARYINEKLPKISVKLITNFQRMSEKKSRTFLEEKLVDCFVCNIDGASKLTYETVKRLKMDQSLGNLETFLRLREEMRSPVKLSVNILTLHNYIHTIKKEFGFYPIALKDPEKLLDEPNDQKETRDYLKKILNPRKDTIYDSGIIAWAERDQVDPLTLNYKEYDCPNFNKIQTIAHIAPDGEWYACCLDSKNELKLGNVNSKSLLEIFHSEERRQLIELLRSRQYGKIKGPCQTVNCCQWLKVHNPENKYLHKIKNIVRRVNPLRSSLFD